MTLILQAIAKVALDLKFDLASLIVHTGSSPNVGHYYAYRHHDSCWHGFDGRNVFPTTKERVTSDQGYVFFYTTSADYAKIIAANRMIDPFDCLEESANNMILSALPFMNSSIVDEIVMNYE